MTALIFSLAPSQVTIAMDTLVTDTEGTPIGYTSKFFPLMHLGGIMCVTGLSNLATDWHTRLMRFVAKDIHHLDEFTTEQLQGIWSQYEDQVSFTSTVYHFGFSQQENQYLGYAYRSANEFTSERLPYAMGIKPPIQDVQIETLPDFIDTMQRQRNIEDSKSSGERLYIGGEIQLAVLENRCMSLATVHRWEDYEEMYTTMCRQFPIA
ncbi:MAG: hypothetical protein ACK4FF_06700 [Limnobacter sp.]|uniref:hypothetical protein n=1 Tax=Limnobacter sp. TaxID=2003368 RepID=UPI0039199E01